MSRSRRSRNTDSETANAVLDGAERLMATRQYAGVSLRDVATAANINFGLLYYYWKTKEDLFAEAVERRVRPIIEERIDRYLALRAEHAQDSPTAIETLIRAFLEPALVFGAGAHSSPYVKGLMKNLYVDPSPEMQSLRERLHKDEHRIFVELCRYYCSHLSEAELFWRLQPVFAAICYATVYDWGSLGSVPRAPSGETSAGLAQFVAFLTADLTAPRTAP